MKKEKETEEKKATTKPAKKTLAVQEVFAEKKHKEKTLEVIQKPWRPIEEKKEHKEDKKDLKEDKKEHKESQAPAEKETSKHASTAGKESAAFAINYPALRADFFEVFNKNIKPGLKN